MKILSQIQKLDNFILSNFKNHIQNKFFDRLMPIITAMGNLGIVWLLIASLLLFSKPYRTIGSIVILTLIISTIMGEGLIKHIVKRSRPCTNREDMELLIKRPITSSFPSGHTLSSFAVAEVLSIYFIHYRLIFLCLALLIALSRLYLYVHYPSDIIAGILLGILCSRITFFVIKEGFVFYKRIILKW